MKNLNTFESFYNFCGTFDKELKKQYKNSELKNQISFPQFCITMYANLLDDAKQLLTKNSNQ
jgi:hypothetical protein